jgi:uncharacterized membrane protein
VFRVLAGIISLGMLLTFPCCVYAALNGVWLAWLYALSCLFGGVGFAGGAWTGRWFCFRRLAKLDSESPPKTKPDSN